MAKTFKEWLIKKLGGYTKLEMDSKPIYTPEKIVYKSPFYRTLTESVTYNTDEEDDPEPGFDFDEYLKECIQSKFFKRDDILEHITYREENVPGEGNTVRFIGELKIAFEEDQINNEQHIHGKHTKVQDWRQGAYPANM